MLNTKVLIPYLAYQILNKFFEITKKKKYRVAKNIIKLNEFMCGNLSSNPGQSCLCFISC